MYAVTINEKRGDTAGKDIWGVEGRKGKEKCN